jgi:hypothetical protein
MIGKMITNDDELEDIEFLRETAEDLYVYLEGLGEDAARKIKRLRYINSRLIKAAANSGFSGYYSRFKEPLDAILACLHIAGGPMDKGKIAETIASGGFVSKKDGPIRRLRDAIYHQTKPANNGKRQLFDSGTGIISLTSEGESEAKQIIIRYGEPTSDDRL